VARRHWQTFDVVSWLRFRCHPPAVQAQSGHDGGTVDDIEPAVGGDDGSSDEGGVSDKGGTSDKAA
jgi:hypothetical protein